MSRAQPKSSPTDQHARRIAAAIAKGRPPAFTPDLDLYLESSPREIFVALEGVARHMPPGGKDETLALGYLFLLQQLLEHLRYRTDRGYADAVRLIADFQADVAARVEAGHIDGHMLAYVGGALHQSRIPASPELSKASARQHVNDREGGPLPDDVHAVLAGLLEACGDDPFALVSSLVEFGHAMPAENRGALAAGLALCGATTQGAAVLLLLDPDRVVRRAVAGALATVASSLSPREVRRLVAMRNWRPENERAEIDGIVRKARAAGVDCAQWEAGSTETILATAIDGSATQGFLLVSPAGRKKRISSILTKGGVADAWSGEPQSRRRIDATLADFGMDAPMLAVSRSYLDRVVSHQLALSVERGVPPPLGLLQVAETLGGVDWQPARMDFGETLARLIAEVPEAMCRGTAVETVLRKSGELADLEAVAQSWFEDGPDIAQAIAGARTRNRAKVVTYLLQSVFAPHRDKWADLLLRTALWMREAPLELDLCWRELAIVAKALADGRDMAEIGLMRDIAQRALAVLANDGRS
jgi:hypothetical protein